MHFVSFRCTGCRDTGAYLLLDIFGFLLGGRVSRKSEKYGAAYRSWNDTWDNLDRCEISLAFNM